ncbi:hypothetical protein SAMN04489717_4964 [Actinopolymorpha singaporensis]|uniref:Uncharacterized protein n=1 Tax=Actinopolymorpha singaporensis TaxID=117157 RepID=A0A1H1XFX6_9ACTN|nr:hypothetical protein SAMN04489717_4964 [Actinopolymorpha singaporensis]
MPGLSARSACPVCLVRVIWVAWVAWVIWVIWVIWVVWVVCLDGDAGCHRILTPRCRSSGPAAKVLRMQWCYRFSEPALGGHGGDRIR